ncbi:MAG: HAMP domain-containing histidine kinase [Elusimicrobia bacterium]|nr:HAMP domain-containing histidine kinase [Elusimicrobiota bacterium]
MRNYLKSLGRERVGNFSRNSYETAFSVFMIVIAYFYRRNPLIVYPDVLYYFVLLMGSNFIFNRLLRRRATVSLWSIDAILLFNIGVITGVLYYSGRGESYFWVLYLLPIFAAALLVNLKDVMGVFFLCSLAAVLLAWPVDVSDLAQVMSLLVKLSVFGLSAIVVYRTAEAKKAAEVHLSSKRHEVEKLAKELSDKDTEILRTASAGELGELSSGVMHDLGNSVTVILLSAQLANEDEKPGKKDLERIMKAARFAKSVISNALDITRNREYVFEEGPVKEPAENAVLLLDYAIKSKNAAIRLNFPEELPAISMSKVHMQRFFINILSNSLSFVPKNGAITVAAARSGDFVELEIADNGPGFPADLLKGGIKAFSTTRRKAGGTGLGLYICAQVVEKHKGEMSLSNGPAGGALIRIKLPVFRAKEV